MILYLAPAHNVFKAFFSSIRFLLDFTRLCKWRSVQCWVRNSGRCSEKGALWQGYEIPPGIQINENFDQSSQEPNTNTTDRNRGTVLREVSKRWPNGEVPYVIEDAFDDAFRVWLLIVGWCKKLCKKYCIIILYFPASGLTYFPGCRRS